MEFESFFQAVESVDIEPDDTSEEDEDEIWEKLFHELPADPITHIWSFATFDELSNYSTVCTSWNRTIMTCNRLWSTLCTTYWNGKYVPSQYRRMLTAPNCPIKSIHDKLVNEVNEPANSCRRRSVSLSEGRSHRPCLRRKSRSFDSADCESAEIIYFSDVDSDEDSDHLDNDHDDNDKNEVDYPNDSDIDMKESIHNNRTIHRLSCSSPLGVNEECIARKAFRLAFMDRLRTTITVDELVSFRWYFRFKEQAGESWMEMDPWWNLNDDDFEIPSDQDFEEQNDAPTNARNLTIQHLVTSTVLSGLSGGSGSGPMGLGSLESDDEMEMKQESVTPTVSLESAVTPNNTNSTNNSNVVPISTSTVPVMSEHDHRLSRCTRVQFERDGSMKRHRVRKIPGLGFYSMRWQFGGSFWKHRLFGTAVQVNQYPSYWITRHPVHWGWVMQSMWVIYTSFAMPMMDSEDDRMIQNDDFGEQGFIEMMQYNVMGGVSAVNGDLEEDDHPELMDNDNVIDLEILKVVKAQKEQKARDLEEQHISRENAVDFQQYLELMLQNDENQDENEEDANDVLEFIADEDDQEEL